MVEANRDEEENEIELIFIEISFFEGEILKFFIFGMRIANCEENKVDRIRIKIFFGDISIFSHLFYSLCMYYFDSFVSGIEFATILKQIKKKIS